MLAVEHVPRRQRRRPNQGTATPGHPSNEGKTRTAPRRPVAGSVLGHHHPPRPRESIPLPPLHNHPHPPPPRHRLATPGVGPLPHRRRHRRTPPKPPERRTQRPPRPVRPPTHPTETQDHHLHQRAHTRPRNANQLISTVSFDLTNT